MTYNAPVEHRAGTLTKSQGPYPAGCQVTTDPEVSPSGSKRGDHTAFRVDPKRFETWVKAGVVRLPAPPRVAKKEAVSGDE